MLERYGSSAHRDDISSPEPHLKRREIDRSRPEIDVNGLERRRADVTQCWPVAIGLVVGRDYTQLDITPVCACGNASFPLLLLLASSDVIHCEVSRPVPSKTFKCTQLYSPDITAAVKCIIFAQLYRLIIITMIFVQ